MSDLLFREAIIENSIASTFAATEVLKALEQSHFADQLDALAQCIWLGLGGGKLSEAEAQTLSELLEKRRSQLKGEASPSGLKKPSTFRLRRFTPRRHQTSPDRRASRERRRMLGGSGGLPNNLRCQYTEGQRAVLFVISQEVKRNGRCDFAIDKIAANAGVCRTTAQNAIHEACRLGLLSVERRPIKGWKSRTNNIRIVSREWLAWLNFQKAGSNMTGSKLTKIPSPTKNKESFFPFSDLKNQSWPEQRKSYRGNIAHREAVKDLQ